MKDRFLRNTMFWGEENTRILSGKNVAVVGIGGVGSYAAEALARAGIGSITVVDNDTISESNINRQLIALSSTVGRYKADVMAERIADINPECNVIASRLYYSAETRNEFFSVKYDYVVDAIDLVSCKLDLIESSIKLNVPVISALGTGNKSDASAFVVTDISKTQNCPLARVMRKELRSRGINHHNVVYSPEDSITPLPLEEPSPGRRSVPASLPWVPSTAGLILAGAVVKDLLKL